MGARRWLVVAAVLALWTIPTIPWLCRQSRRSAAPQVSGLPSTSSAPGTVVELHRPQSPKLDTQLLLNAQRWRTYVWSPGEVHLIVTQDFRMEGVLRGRTVLEQGKNRITVAMPSVDAAGFATRAKELMSLPGVKEVNPVFYPSAEASASRRGPRLYLTRHLVATLPEGTDAAVVASRWGAALVQRLEFMGNTVLLETQEPLETLALAMNLLQADALAAVPEFAMRPIVAGSLPASVNDPLYPNQWHLKNTGQGGGTAGEDLRVEQAWDVTQGAGSVIGIVDQGVQHSHPDLAANYLPTSSFDFNDGDPDPTPVEAWENHGTAVAGCAVAVGNNSLGVTGVAPQAKFAALRLVGAPVVDSTIASAMNYSNNVIQIKTNSWSFTGGVELDTFTHFTDLAAISGSAVNGRSGKGVVFVFCAMNDGIAGGNVNNSGFTTQRHVITVGAVTFNGVHSPFSNRGAALLVCAPSGGSSGERAIETTDRTGPDGYNTSVTGDYADSITGSGFSGTSASAPLAAGVVGLMLAANPNLSARDVQHVLVRLRARPTWAIPGGSPTGRADSSVMNTATEWSMPPLPFSLPKSSPMLRPSCPPRHRTRE